MYKGALGQKLAEQPRLARRRPRDVAVKLMPMSTVLLHPLFHTIIAAGSSIAHEVQLESIAHVTTITAGQCMLSAAPDVMVETPVDEQELLDALPNQLRAQLALEEANVERQLAACLATPAEPVEEREARGSSFERLSRMNAERTTREVGLYEMYNTKDSLELPGRQLQLLIEDQRMRAAVRRQRRRALLRMLRASRQTIASLVGLRTS